MPISGHALELTFLVIHVKHAQAAWCQCPGRIVYWGSLSNWQSMRHLPIETVLPSSWAMCPCVQQTWEVSMIDTFDPQGCLAHEGEYLNEIADGEILDLRDSGEAADLVNNVRRARLEVHRLVRYALIILDQERSKGNEDLIVNDSSNVTALISPKLSGPSDHLKKQGRQRMYARKALKLDLDLIRYEFPDHRFHPSAMALMEAVQAGNDEFNAYLASPDGMNASKRALVRKRQQLAQQVIYQVREYSRTAKYREGAERIRHATWQRIDSTRKLVEHMFTKRSKLLCVRVDLLYRHVFRGERYDASLPGHPGFEMVGVQREHLLNIVRREILKDCFYSYIVRIEWAPGTGFHLHLMLLIDGRERMRGVRIADLIGLKWRTEVTNGQGYDFNCNRKALRGGYPVRGTGMFERSDVQGRLGLMKAAEYLAKADHFVSFHRSSRQRTYFRSQIG